MLQSLRGARAAAGFCLLLAGCANAHGPTVVDVGNSTLALEALGGWSPYRLTTFVDSAAGRWERVRCEPWRSMSPCRTTDVVASGPLSAAQVVGIFAAVRTPAFRALPNDIPGGGGPEVDGTLYTLTVPNGASPRIVQWRSLAPLPPPLETLLARLDAATNGMWK